MTGEESKRIESTGPKKENAVEKRESKKEGEMRYREKCSWMIECEREKRKARPYLESVANKRVCEFGAALVPNRTKATSALWDVYSIAAREEHYQREKKKRRGVSYLDMKHPLFLFSVDLNASWDARGEGTRLQHGPQCDGMADAHKQTSL